MVRTIIRRCENQEDLNSVQHCFVEKPEGRCHYNALYLYSDSAFTGSQ